MSAPAATPLLVDVPGAARLLSVHAQTIRKWIHAGRLAVVRLPAVRPGKVSSRLRVRVADLERLIRESVEA